MTYRVASRAVRAANPMRPNGPETRALKAALLARTSVRATPQAVATAGVNQIHAHFRRGPRSLRPHLMARPMDTISISTPSTLSGMHDFRVVADPGLGFSLKPPKFIRKAAATVVKAVKDTTKEVKHLATIKNIGIAAGALIAAPVVLPALAAGAGAVGGALAHGAAGLLTAGKVGGGLVVKGVSKLFHSKPIADGPPAPPWDPGVGTPPTDSIPPPPPSSAGAAAGGGAAPMIASDGGVASSGGGSYGGGGGLSTPTTGDDTAAAEPAQAGMFGGASPLVIGAVAIGGALLLKSALKRRGR